MKIVALKKPWQINAVSLIVQFYMLTKKLPIKITRDSGANVKLLKKLENKGLIIINDVMLENGRENRRVTKKILPVGIFGIARFGECIFVNEDNKLDEILKIIGNHNVLDAMHLEAHIRSGNDYFVTEDKDDILNKKIELEKQFGIKVISPKELEKEIEF